VDCLPTGVQWIIVAAIGLSPILTYWLTGVLGRFLRRTRWHMSRDASVGADRSESTDEPN
jgi:hypothetical protein